MPKVLEPSSKQHGTQHVNRRTYVLPRQQQFFLSQRLIPDVLPRQSQKQAGHFCNGDKAVRFSSLATQGVPCVEEILLKVYKLDMVTVFIKWDLSDLIDIPIHWYV